MNRTTIALLAVILALAGCAGVPITPQSVSQRSVPLDRWLEETAFPAIVQRLRTDTFLKGRPFVIARMAQGQITGRIDALTDQVRRRLERRLLAHADIALVTRHPVQPLERPYRLQELECGNFREYEMILGIRIQPEGDRLAGIDIRVHDRREGTWVSGFAVYCDAALLTDAQAASLAQNHPDRQLRGMRELPFAETEADLAAAYLARNLSCIFRDGNGDDRIRVFVAPGQGHGWERRLLDLLTRQLNYVNEIALTTERAAADWTVQGKAMEIGTGAGLYQFWVETHRREGGDFVRGLATYAYLRREKRNGADLAGRWQVRGLDEDADRGVLHVQECADGRFTGTLYGAGGRDLVAGGIVLERSGTRVRWAYFDQRQGRTFDVSGVIDPFGDTMAASVASYPPRRLLHWELSRAD